MGHELRYAAAAVLGAGLLGLTAAPALAQRNPLRDAYFGETHVHTSWSFDACIFVNTNTGTLSLSMLAGTEWTLVSLDGQSLPLGIRPPTIVFDGARVSGFGGCNRYMGQVVESMPGAISIGQLAATKMACPPPVMEVEDRYLASLARMSLYTFSAGRLLLSGVDGGTSYQLTFERSGP